MARVDPANDLDMHPKKEFTEEEKEIPIQIQSHVELSSLSISQSFNLLDTHITLADSKESEEEEEN